MYVHCVVSNKIGGKCQSKRTLLVKYFNYLVADPSIELPGSNVLVQESILDYIGIITYPLLLDCAGFAECCSFFSSFA